MELLFEIDKKDYDLNGKVFCRPSARGIILKDGKIAVIYSRKSKFYKIPGGGVEPGEDNLSAMIREVKEESGLTVLPETIKEFGYVHRIQKGEHEPVFVQDNFYYLCDVENTQELPRYTDTEKSQEFIPVFVDLTEAIKVNQEYVKAHPWDVMIERELRVMKIISKW